MTFILKENDFLQFVSKLHSYPKTEIIFYDPCRHQDIRLFWDSRTALCTQITIEKNN